nr:hypothetical protein BaRGS_001966 [Batillaria attramentaria]
MNIINNNNINISMNSINNNNSNIIINIITKNNSNISNIINNNINNSNINININNNININSNNNRRTMCPHVAMPGRMNGLEADGEWSDASDDAVKSGSATDASRGDMDDTSSRLAGSKLSLSSFTGSSLTKRDPVHSILDKIDAELAAMSSPSPQAKVLEDNPREHQTLINNNSNTFRDDVAAQQAAEDFLSDLDSVVAQQIDDRFKEIMLKKKGAHHFLCFVHDSTLSPFPRTTAGYGTDNDSVKTEDFESRFQSLLQQTSLPLTAQAFDSTV